MSAQEATSDQYVLMNLSSRNYHVTVIQSLCRHHVTFCETLKGLLMGYSIPTPSRFKDY